LAGFVRKKLWEEDLLKLFLWLPATVIALVILIVGTDPTRAQQALQKITLAQGGQGIHTMPLYVAKEGGLFEKEGLQLDWVDVGSGPRSTAAVMGGSADITVIGLFEVIRSAAEGADLVGICRNFDTYPQTLTLTNEAIAKAGIASGMNIDEKVKRLKDLRIGISSPGSTTDGLIRSVLVARGYDPDKYVSLQPLGGNTALYAAFQKNVIDGFVWTAPEPQRAVLEKLGHIIVDPLTGETPEFQGVIFSVLVASRDAIKAKPQVLRGAVRAMTAAIKLIHDDPEKARMLTRRSFMDVDEAAFNLGFKEYLAGIPDSPVITPEQVTKTADWRRMIDKKLKPAPYEAVVYPGFAVEAAKDILGK
jgi:NitT/TauT family transport system substrate-binding protein